MAGKSVRRQGRPKDNAKHAAILAAARALFLGQPFESVTMDAVAYAANVSKMTVYSHFHDKETLFEAVVTATSDSMIGSLKTVRSDGDVRDRLLAIGQAFLGLVVGPDMCAMPHALAMTLRTNRPLAERFYAAGPRRVRNALASILAEAESIGVLRMDDACLAAEDLVSLWISSRADRISFGLAEPASAEEVRAMATRGTDVFLRAYRRDGA